MKTPILFVSVFLAVASAVSVNFQNCQNAPAEFCTITDVNIEPCKEYPRDCKLKKGADASIVVKFKPNFASSNLTIGVYWVNNALELGFPDLDSKGCSYTTCPTVPGQEQVYDYKLHLAKKLPQGTFQTKWKIWDVDNEANMCCFITYIALKR